MKNYNKHTNNLFDTKSKKIAETISEKNTLRSARTFSLNNGRIVLGCYKSTKLKCA